MTKTAKLIPLVLAEKKNLSYFVRKGVKGAREERIYNVKCTVVQALREKRYSCTVQVLRLCTGSTAHRGSRGIRGLLEKYPTFFFYSNT